MRALLPGLLFCCALSAASASRNLLAPQTGSCGPSNNNVKCGGGNCCSQWGWCGKTADHCGTGCQPAFGAPCSSSTASPPPPTTASPPPPPKASSPPPPTTASSPPPPTARPPPPATSPPPPPPPTTASGNCGPGANDAKCATSLCCSKWGWCGTSADHCGTGCQLSFGSCSSSTASPPPPTTASPPPPTTASPPPPTTASSPPPPPPPTTNGGESAAGITKAEFTLVFSSDTDRCGTSCTGYSSTPNTQAVIDKHWNHFKSAAAALGFNLQGKNESSIFFGNIRHEYGGNLDQMREYCSRNGQTCPAYSGGSQYYGRGPMQLTHDYNYQAMFNFMVGDNILTSPNLVADASLDLGWRAAMAFWTGSDFNCMGSWVSGSTCPVAARAGIIADVTRRINGALECGNQSKQLQRVQLINTVRSTAFGLPQLTSNLYC